MILTCGGCAGSTVVVLNGSGVVLKWSKTVLAVVVVVVVVVVIDVELDPVVDVVDNVVVVVVALVVENTTVSLLTIDGTAVVVLIVVVVDGGSGGDGYKMYSKMSRFRKTRGGIVVIGLSIFSFFLFSRLTLSCLSSSSRVAR